MVCELPLLSGGVSWGRAEFEEHGLRLRFRCRLDGNKGLCKLYAARGDRRALLGTPAPMSGELYLERTLSRSELERAGCYPPERVEVDGAAAVKPATWQDVTPQMPRFGDALLSRLFRQGGWGWKIREGGVVLCHGWQENTPFPAVPLLCLVRLERVGGRYHVYCYLNERGELEFPS